MSSRRARSGGTVRTSKARRSSRSWRKRPTAAAAGRSTLVAPIRRTSTWTGALPPTRSKLPYSTTRSSRSCTGEAGVGDLVEEQAAAVGELEAAGAAPDRAGERAGLVAEQLALEQGLRDRGGVQLDQRPLPARREVVQAGRDQLLAGAALADHQHRPVERRDARDLLHQIEERPRSGRAAAAARRGRWPCAEIWDS